MTAPHLPRKEAIGVLSAKPIIFFPFHPSHEPHANDDSRDVHEKDVMKDVVPPALSEVRQNVLE